MFSKLNTSKAVIASFVLLFSFGIIQAQQPTISMEEAVALASENYPSLKAALLSVEKEKALKSTAWDFGDTNFFTSGEEIGNNNRATYTTLGIGQSDIDIFGISSKNKLANEQIKLAKTNVELSTLSLKQKVQTAWAKAYTAKKIFESYDKIFSVFSGLNKAIDLRFETEAISKLEYNATKNQGKLIELKKEQALVSYKMALQELNQWLFTDKWYDVAPTSFNTFDNDLLVNEANLKDHALFKLWQNQLDIANAQQKVSRSQFLPKISAQYGFQKIASQSGFNSFQVGVKIPLIFNKAKGQSKASKINRAIIEQENMTKQTQFKSTFYAMLSKYEQLEASWQYYKNEALPLAIEQRNGATLSYKEGAMDYIAFLQNMKAAIQLEINTWNILQDYLESKIQLEYFLTPKQ